METIQAIRSRRSIRKYQPKPVPHEVIEQIVADAAYAPSWKNTQIARYVLVEDRTTIDKMAEEMVLDFKLNEKTLKNCPAVMVLTYVTGRSGYERDGSATTPLGEGYTFFDCGATVEALCLAAHDAGLATLIMGIFDGDKLRSSLKIPETEVPVVVLALGYPADVPQMPKRRALEEVLRVF